MVPDASSKRILVTGAAGFIGNVVAKRLMAMGRPVVGTDRVLPQGEDAAFPSFVADARDLGRHMGLLAEGCDGIIHCGGISGPMLARDNPADLLDVNVRSTIQLLDLCRILKARRFVLCSSVSAYGRTPEGVDRVDESTPLSASTFYGTSKAAADLVLRTFGAQAGVSATALRIGWVYGPRRMTDGVLHPMLRSGLGGPAFAVPDGGDHAIQFVHVEDVADALIAAFDAPAVAPAYNVTANPRQTMSEIGDFVRRLLPAARIDLGPGSLSGEPFQAEMSIALAARDLGWKPKVAFEAGVARYADWLRDHPF